MSETQDKEQEQPEEFVHEFYKKFKMMQWDAMMEGFRKEMTKQVGEMQRWRNYHIPADPEGMANLLSEYLDLCRKAINYRNLYSKRKKELKTCQGVAEQAARAGDVKALKKAQADYAEKHDEMIAIIFKVYRIYFTVKPQLPVEGEDDNVVDYHD